MNTTISKRTHFTGLALVAARASTSAMTLAPSVALAVPAGGFDAPKGAVIEEVVADSPADKADLKKGAIILSFNGKEILELRDLTRAVARTAPDQMADVIVLHKGKKVSREVTIGTLGAQDA